MKSESHIERLLKIVAIAVVITGVVHSSYAADKPESTTDKTVAKAAETPASEIKQAVFKSPQEAMDSLVKASEAFDTAELKLILGPGSEDLVTSGDPVMDKERATSFAAKAKEKNSVTIDPKNPARATISVGDDDFPLPIPLVKSKAGWSFDSKTGRQEILFRRIGANELDAIAICRGYVDAQNEYATEKHDGSRVNQYAQKIISTSGKQDGLAWKDADGTWKGPLGEDVAKAIEQGYEAGKKDQPYHGYYFKILKGQGASAPMGKLDYIVNDIMIGGFALAAAPAQYRVTGVKTFIVGRNGVVYEKDLGPDTLKTFQAMERFDPDKTWHVTNDEW